MATESSGRGSRDELPDGVVARETFEKAGYWPNEVLWKVWSQAWIASRSALSESAALTALRELVACKDMHDRIENRGNGISADEARELQREYRVRRPVAWERAREVLASIDSSAGNG